MKNMKIRVNDANRQEVKAALEALGYNFAGLPPDYNFLYTYEGMVDMFYGTNQEHFDNKEHEEHVLFAGEFKPMSYFQQPKTPEQKPVERPPLGLRPRHIVRSLRMQEILEAMHRYAQEGKKWPDEWTDELAQLNKEAE